MAVCQLLVLSGGIKQSLVRWLEGWVALDPLPFHIFVGHFAVVSPAGSLAGVIACQVRAPKEKGRSFQLPKARPRMYHVSCGPFSLSKQSQSSPDSRGGK